MARRIELPELKRLLEQGAQLVEVLPAPEYGEVHLPGAINVPLKALDHQSTARLDRARPVVVYCHDYLWDLSPRAACRLETLGFGDVYDYVPGKADWLAHGLPVEGEHADVPTAGALARDDVVVCGLDAPVAGVRKRVERSPYGFALVTAADRVVLGRLRASAMKGAAPDATAEEVMEPGPSTVRADTPARDLARRLAERDLTSAVVSTPEGRLIGIARRSDLEASSRA
jgi:rhodanese-related sulfurtransferase/CBS domain-containing protein